jgi:TRAP-type C4-dicarboxylate transport system substrate-binding protein
MPVAAPKHDTGRAPPQQDRRKTMKRFDSLARNRRRICLIAAMASVFALGASTAAAQQVIRLGHVGFPGSLFDISANKFAQDANQALKGKVEVRVFHSSQIGTDEQMIKGIRVASPEMAVPSTIMSTVDQKFGVFEMPYLIVSRAHMKKAAENPEVQKALFDALPARGVRVLGVWENGFRHVKMFQTYGANPSPMPFAEVYSALQQGVMDGQENPFSQIASAKFQEVQKFLSLTGHVYTPAYLIVSEDFWKKLPKDVQDTLLKVAAATGDFARSEGDRLDRELQGKLAPPMQSNEPDKEAFIKASAAVYQEFGAKVPGGGDLVKLIQSLR